jgi:hypothetical protein
MSVNCMLNYRIFITIDNVKVIFVPKQTVDPTGTFYSDEYPV